MRLINSKTKKVYNNHYKYLVIVVLVFFAAIFSLPKVYSWVQANESKSNNEIIPSEDGEKGTENNPFVILEIVPYEGYAEIGYLIEGCEPVDMEKLRYSSSMTKGTISSVADIGNWDTLKQQFPDEFTDGNIPNGWSEEKASETEGITLYGYYERVKDNEGVFKVEDKDNKIDYIKAEDGTGNIVWKTLFKEDIIRKDKKRQLEYIGDRVYTYRTDYTYRQGYAYTYDHRHEFLMTSLGIKKEKIYDYNIMVKTIEPRELNDNLDWIDRADLISISPKSHDTGLLEIWGEFNLAGKDPINNPDDFAKNDLSWEATLRIFEKVHIKEDAAAMILDWTVYTEPPGTSKSVTTYQINYNEELSEHYNNGTGNSNNVYKLALMSRTMNPVFFYNLFLANRGNGTPLIQNGMYTKIAEELGSSKEETSLIQKGRYTLQPKEDADLYWNQYTFMFTMKDGRGAFGNGWELEEQELWNKIQFDYNVYRGNSNVSVRDNIYSYNGDKPLTQEFASGEIDVDTIYTEEFKEFIEKNPGAKNTPAFAVKYILSQKKKEENIERSIKVLDLQPTNDFDLKPLTIRMLFPHLGGKIDIVRMTSAEFVGKIEDLNSTYDLINLGMNSGGYDTDYNDNNLDGKIYLHVGDKITGSKHNVNWLSSYNEQNTTRMPGNDITQKKMEDLEEYITAGYPVIVDPLLYYTGTEATKKAVDHTSYIYKLISGYNSFSNVIDSSKGTKESVNWNKPKLKLHDKPKEYVGNSDGVGKVSEDQYINSVDIDFRKLRFQYEIISTDPNQTFKVELYIDANADGRFDEDEKNMEQDITANTKAWIEKELARNYFGVIPWKIKIYDSVKHNLRDEIIGISAIKRASSEKETIKVLQINHNGNSTLNLQDSGHFKTYTQNLNDYNINFETISVNQFEARFYGITFDPTNPDTNKLKDYNMLVFGFADMYGPITNQEALKNVKHFISQGKSVLFTHDITSFKNSTAESHEFGYYFNKDFRTILGLDRFGARDRETNYPYDNPTSPYGDHYTQIHGYTYYALKRIAHDGSDTQKTTYKGLKFNDDNNETTKARKLNNGQLTQYPYAIDDTITIASTHAQWFQLNLEDPDIVVWYTLASDNKQDSYVYDLSPKDAANNYYIYNKGNVTYSGVGHSKVDPISGYSPMEIKLFVNTMVAAYRAGVSPPTIEITNEEECIFIPDETYVEGDYLDIKFIPHDYNLKAQKLGVKVFVDGVVEPLIIWDKETRAEVSWTFETKSGEKYFDVIKDKEYIARYKKSLFTTEANREVTFLIENDTGLQGLEKLKLKERILFNLH